MIPNIGPLEIVVLLVIALIVFGPKRLPELGNSLGRIPVWANEGLAQFYQSFQERDSGRVAIIGSPIGDHVAVLRQSTPMLRSGVCCARSRMCSAAYCSEAAS